MNNIIYYNKINKDNEVFFKKNKSDLGIDLISLGGTVPRKSFGLIPFNLILDYKKIYKKYKVGAFIFPRSSLYKKYKCILANSVGVIDPDFNGRADIVSALLFNTSDVDVIISSGDRLCQLIFLRIFDKFDLKIKNKANSKSRGGFGSTG